uniref:Neuropeptide-Like Protein n=1 Tax=Mesocestoides corti TaxID=53468 RepID=A0A5K3FPP6_MESCO
MLLKHVSISLSCLVVTALALPYFPENLFLGDRQGHLELLDADLIFDPRIKYLMTIARRGKMSKRHQITPRSPSPPWIQWL